MLPCEKPIGDSPIIKQEALRGYLRSKNSGGPLASVVSLARYTPGGHTMPTPLAETLGRLLLDLSPDSK